MDADVHADTGVDLSVVIACYNGAATLGEQLDALAGQECPATFEVIVADNGSTDRSVEIARSYTDRLPLRVVDASGVRGPAHARNRGVQECRAPLVAFCDADDVVSHDWLTVVLDCLAEHEFVAGRVDITRLNDARVAASRTMDQQEGLQESGTAIGLKHAGAGNMALHRDVFVGVGGFDESLECLEDSDLCWRIQLAGTELHYCPDMLIWTRMRSTLPGMIRQGYRYGRCFAELEERYGLAGAGAPGPRVRLRERLAHLAARGPRGIAWQIAWHAGHRRRRPARRAAASGPATARAA